MSECNEQTGCPLPVTDNQQQQKALPEYQKHQVIFVTDPICSHCWAIEPVWRRLQLEYDVTVNYIHGGLLPGWQGFADSGNAISKPSDVIPHWNHVAKVSGQPIDPSVWTRDPLSNSYILCQAAIAIRLLKPASESAFVRKMREQVFLHGINIAKLDELVKCAEFIGVEKQAFVERLDSPQVLDIFKNEQSRMSMLGARGFPSLIFLGQNPCVLVGSRPYQLLKQALLSNSKHSPLERQYGETEKLQQYATWTLQEACEVLQKSTDASRYLLLSSGFVESAVPAGTLWVRA